jgi:copper(I)-binding protein
MTVTASSFVEKHISDYLERLSLNHCWLFNFNVISNTEAFLRSVIFSKYSTVGFVINENRKDKAEELVAISKKYNVVAVAYLSEMLNEQNFLVCVKSK